MRGVQVDELWSLDAAALDDLQCVLFLSAFPTSNKSDEEVISPDRSTLSCTSFHSHQVFCSLVDVLG